MAGKTASTPLFEKARQYSAALFHQHATEYIYTVIHAGQCEHIDDTACSASLRIPRSKDQPSDTCVNDRRRAHHARLQRYIQSCTGEAVTTERATAGSQRLDLGVRSRIMDCNGSIESFRGLPR